MTQAVTEAPKPIDHLPRVTAPERSLITHFPGFGYLYKLRVQRMEHAYRVSDDAVDMMNEFLDQIDLKWRRDFQVQLMLQLEILDDYGKSSSIWPNFVDVEIRIPKEFEYRAQESLRLSNKYTEGMYKLRLEEVAQSALDPSHSPTCCSPNQMRSPPIPLVSDSSFVGRDAGGNVRISRDSGSQASTTLSQKACAAMRAVVPRRLLQRKQISPGMNGSRMDPTAAPSDRNTGVATPNIELWVGNIPAASGSTASLLEN